MSDPTRDPTGDPTSDPTSDLTVTCLCLTRDRRRWLPRAIDCFTRQTYPHKRLLIVADGEDIWDLLPSTDPRITLLHVPDDRRPATIGDKRNYGCSFARTDLIAHWDDDDWSHPDRLADQIRRLESTNAQVTGYRAMLFHDGAHWWRYEGLADFSLGTSLLYRRSWWEQLPFPSLQVSEDSTFVFQAAHNHVLAVVDGVGMQVAAIHSGNTSPKELGSNYIPLPGFGGVEGYTW